MKKLIIQIVLGLLVNGVLITAFAGVPEIPSRLIPGLYVGVGGSWNTIDESFNSLLFTSNGRSGQDKYDVNLSRLAPTAQVGYWVPLCNGWLWGVAGQWKYLAYETNNVNASRGQNLPNATFSSINIFGPKIDRDFTSQSEINNEVLLLLYFGKQFNKGYAYLGVGPALFTASNSIFVSSVHTPSGVGDHLVSTSVSSDKTVWGGAIQVGYNYYVEPTLFVNFSYTYAQTGKNNFNNSVNAAILNGASTPDATTLNLHRSISFRVQEVMFTINKVFEI